MSGKRKESDTIIEIPQNIRKLLLEGKLQTIVIEKETGKHYLMSDIMDAIFENKELET